MKETPAKTDNCPERKGPVGYPGRYENGEKSDLDKERLSLRPVVIRVTANC